MEGRLNIEKAEIGKSRVNGRSRTQMDAVGENFVNKTHGTRKRIPFCFARVLAISVSELLLRFNRFL